MLYEWVTLLSYSYSSWCAVTQFQVELGWSKIVKLLVLRYWRLIIQILWQTNGWFKQILNFVHPLFLYIRLTKTGCVFLNRDFQALLDWKATAAILDHRCAASIRSVRTFFTTVHLNVFNFRIFLSSMRCVLFDVIDAIDLICCRDREVCRVQPDHQGNQGRGYELFSNLLGQEIFQFSFSSPLEVVLKYVDFPLQHFSNDQCLSA